MAKIVVAICWMQVDEIVFLYVVLHGGMVY